MEFNQTFILATGISTGFFNNKIIERNTNVLAKSLFIHLTMFVVRKSKNYKAYLFLLVLLIIALFSN